MQDTTTGGSQGQVLEAEHNCGQCPPPSSAKKASSSPGSSLDAGQFGSAAGQVRAGVLEARSSAWTGPPTAATQTRPTKKIDSFIAAPFQDRRSWNRPIELGVPPAGGRETTTARKERQSASARAPTPGYALSAMDNPYLALTAEFKRRGREPFSAGFVGQGTSRACCFAGRGAFGLPVHRFYAVWTGFKLRGIGSSAVWTGFRLCEHRFYAVWARFRLCGDRFYAV